ncbi:MAG: head protein [Mesorhizobium sp.]|uniref:DUF5309 domain-containing protein n=1 Tax=unclassified Mesorhizobium TaxID=325217 RepID=UPI000FCC1F01|nr:MULTISPECIES: DUF5309 domain-containing protein [unclassified Mesorhizobium]RUW04043.1 head protein [Mesorhizobium sp. M1A.F.Ca.IN.020.04.1.1]RUW04106.1 head protein [Mesorhizobium sp. M1A.F.Ca.IN.020.04.1.1]TIN82758.1 MAG: head protein [Mesorhizobium sp.]TIN88346.1 MAG: head protein [Mesorhizobium sp.]
MATVANTVLTTQAVGNREELDDFVSMITPTDTPIYTMAGKSKAASKHPEWEYESLDTTGDNAQPEGNEYTFDAVSPPTRVGNYTQIFTKTFRFSGTQQAVDNAGNAEKRAHELMKKGKAIRKDMEYSIVVNTASTNSDPRRSGGLPTWLTSNVSRGAGGSSGGFSSGVTTVETTGTLRAWTKALTDSVLQSIYQNGGDVTTVVVSPYNKGVFATFMSDSNVASFRYAAGKGTNTIIGTADIYESPWGPVKVMPNRVMSTAAATARRVFALDPDMVKWMTLRAIQEDTVAKTGDAENGVLIAEGCLKVVNQAGIGVVADVFGLTAST